MHTSKLTWQYVLICAVAVFLSWILHEGAHWLTAEALGYNATLNLNSVSLAEGVYHNGDEHLVSAAGPLFTILQALVVFVLLLRSRNRNWYPFLFVPLYMRAMAGVLNAINLNDEGRISNSLGLGTYTLSLLVCAFLAFLVYRASKTCGYRAGFQWINILLTMLFSSIIILADQAFNLRIIG